MCYASLEFPPLKLRQGSTLIAHKDAFFFLKDTGASFDTIGVFNARIILIKIKN